MYGKGTALIASLMMIALLLPVAALVTAYGSGPGTRLDPTRDQASVHFNVTYPNGTPAVGATIEILSYYSNSGTPQTGITNSSGKARIDVYYYNWGPCGITLYDPGEDHFLKLDRQISPNDVIFYDLMLSEHLPYDNIVKGTVWRLDTMTAASGVKVQISGHDRMGRYVEESVYADGSGGYSLNVPDTIYGYLLEVIEPAPGYDPSMVQVFTDPDKAENLYDLYIRPELVAVVPFSFRVINTTTMEPMVGLSSFAAGSPIGTDLSFDHRTLVYDPVERRFGTSLFPGDYEIIWNGLEDPQWNVSYRLETYVLVNSTPLALDIELDVVPELRPVKLRVWSSAGGPVGYCLVNYDHQTFEGDQRTSVSLDGQATPDGWLSFGAPPEVDVKVRAWYWGYHENEFTIPAGPASSPVELNITLQEGDPYAVPQGDYSFFIRDKVTGVPLPSASFYGFTWDVEGKSYSISGNSGYDGFANGSADAAKYPVIKVSHPLGTAILRNVTINEGLRTDLTVDLERRGFPEEAHKYTIDLKDPQGQPLSSVHVRIGSNELGMDLAATSDRSGRVTFHARPSSYSIRPVGGDGYWFSSAQWSGENDLELAPGGGHLGYLTLYPTRPLTAIEGHVIDSSTMRPLRFRPVTAGSYHPDEGPTRQMGPLYPWMEELFHLDEEGINLMFSYHHSDRSGFYRAYGRESVRLGCWSEGYFQYEEEVDLSTRAPVQKDILLDPIPAPTTTLQGTLVNEDGSPVRGMVLLFETDHPGNIFLENHTGTDGKFSFDLHPAGYRIMFGNETLHSETTVVVNESGLTDLVLRLVPYSYLNGTVEDAEGTPISGIQISLFHPGTDEGTILENITTDTSGRFSFILEKGTYRVDFTGTDSYLSSTSGIITLTGWNDADITLVLLNRTSGTVMGRVQGDGGPFTDGIEGATVWLNDALGSPIMSAVTGVMGQYEIEDIPYGTGYTINATPPSNALGEPSVRSGYLSSSPKSLDISMAVTIADIGLSYYMLPAAGYFNITFFGPQGDDVLLDEPIRLAFSEAVDKEDFPPFLEISPEPAGMVFNWDLEGLSVRIDHAPLAPNTTYLVKVDRYLVSSAGSWLWGGEDLIWNFTTGEEQGAWKILSKTVEVGSDMTTYINATAPPGLDVFVVISGVGSYRLNETGPGIYASIVPATALEWDTEYAYHFSDRADGPDLAPELGGRFRTPERTGPVDDDDDDDDDDEDDDDDGGRFLAAICIGTAVLVLVLIIIIVLVLVLGKKGGEESWEE